MVNDEKEEREKKKILVPNVERAFVSDLSKMKAVQLFNNCCELLLLCR